MRSGLQNISLSASDDKIGTILNVKTIICSAIETILFHLLSRFDGAEGVYPVLEQPSDYAFYLQTYNFIYEEEGILDEISVTKVRIKAKSAIYDELHDLFSVQFKTYIQEKLKLKASI